jgi:UDP-2-acetamido-2-deoxy-ribo-hexuluronate aminotransferase
MEFIDLKSQYSLIKDSVQKHINTVLEHGSYILGPEVTELEKILAEYVGVKHCITCASGTDALLMPLMAYGIGPGDAVFTTTFSFFATAEVISLLGATPVFVDIDEHTYNIDCNALDNAIQNVISGKKRSSGMPDKLKPKAIIPVDLFGLAADYDVINAIAKKYDLVVIEDAAQSFGGVYKGKKTCSPAPVAATSFFPAKPLGCYGDGGAIFTEDTALAETLLSIRVHGKGADKYENIRIGINGRLDTMQAAILLCKMELFDQEIRLRQEAASRYSELLKSKAKTPIIPAGYTSAWAQYTIACDNRDYQIQLLKKAGIPTAIYYPKPLHLQKAFDNLGYRKGDYPVAEKVSDRVFSIPMHPYLTNDEIDSIIQALMSC